MSLRTRVTPLLLPCLCLVATPVPDVPAAAARAVTFVVSGVVEEPGGKPVRGARVLLQDLLEPAALTDAGGRYLFSYTVPDVEALAAAPLRLVVRARHRGWALALPAGANALAVELRFVRTAGGSARLEVRSDDGALAKRVAASLRAPGDATVHLRADFMRRMGGEDRSEPRLTAVEVVPLALRPGPGAGIAPARPAGDSAGTAPPGPVPAPVVARASQTPAPPRPAIPRDERRVGAEGDTNAGRGIRISVRTDTAAPAPGGTADPGAGATLRVVHGIAVSDSESAAPASGACECRVKGTVEVRSEKHLSATLRVVVSLADVPASRDTVALFMGPPRSFDLGHVPCGSHRLEVRPLSAQRFAVLSPATGGFDCAPARRLQFRVVLEPR